MVTLNVFESFFQLGLPLNSIFSRPESKNNTQPPLQSLLEFFHIGKIKSVSDGVIVASGLTHARSGEMVLFSNGLKGMILNLERYLVKIVIFGSE
jgi:F0F1-type ATP synthase alpha subunit